MRDLLVEDFLHGQRDDDPAALLEEPADFRARIARVVERHEEPLLTVLAHHHGLEGVDVRAARLVLLLDLDGVELFLQREFAGLGLAAAIQRGHGEDAAVQTQVADLRLVRDAAAVLCNFFKEIRVDFLHLEDLIGGDADIVVNHILRNLDTVEQHYLRPIFLH